MDGPLWQSLFILKGQIPPSSHISRKHQQSPFDQGNRYNGYTRDSQNSRNTPRQRHLQRDEDCFDIGTIHILCKQNSDYL